MMIIMKKLGFCRGMAACVLMAGAALSAEAAVSHVDSLVSLKAASTKVVYLDGRPESAEVRKADRDSMFNVVSSFYYDQFRQFQDPDAPYFMFLSKEAGLSMGIGGSVRMRMFYDWDGAMPTNSFAPYTIPIPANPLSMRHFATTPSGTGLFFRVIGYHERIGTYQLYIETDFTGYQSRGLKLKKAYAMVRDFTVGYAPSTFSDPAAQPAVIDAAGNNNKFTHTSVLVRYMPCFKKRWFVGVSVETPSTSIDQSSTAVQARSEWLPDAAALVQYQWAPGQHVRLSGIVRSLSYRSMTERANCDKTGWGVQLSSVAHPLRQLTTYVTAVSGRGISGLGSDLSYGHYDLLVNPKNPLRMYTPLSFGWTVGLQYNFRPNLFASVTASETRLYTRAGTAGTEYKYGIFACANVFWNILPRWSVGAELDYGRRKNVSGIARDAWRANIMCAFTF